MPTQLHDASVKHFRHEAKALLRALEAGNAEAARRVSHNLPRLSGASVPRPRYQLLADKKSQRPKV